LFTNFGNGVNLLTRKGAMAKFRELDPKIISSYFRKN
jgi:hypothetical protein